MTAAPYGLTANDRAIPGGFTGSVAQFLAWLKSELAYGGVRVSEPVPDQFRPTKQIRRVELVTAGYSDDEALLGRVHGGSMFSMMFWESTHRGGLYVYEIPVDKYDSAEQVEWLEPPTEVFAQIYRARELVVRTAHDDEFSIALPTGAQLSFHEHSADGGARDICNPAGVLVVEPLDDPFV